MVNAILEIWHLRLKVKNKRFLFIHSKFFDILFISNLIITEFVPRSDPGSINQKMIAINVLILVVLIFENGRQVRDAASVSESNGFYSQLRRRSVSSSKSVENDVSRKINEDPEEVKIHSHVMPEPKRRIIFGLRQPQPAKATENARPQPQKSTYFNYFYNSAVAGISRALDAIDNLEKEYSEQQQQMTQMESFITYYP